MPKKKNEKTTVFRKRKVAEKTTEKENPKLPVREAPVRQASDKPFNKVQGKPIQPFDKLKAVSKTEPQVHGEPIQESTEKEIQEFPKNNNGKEKYYQAIGRRKNSIARVRLYTKKSTDIIEEESALLFVNGKDYIDYFSDVNLRSVVESPLRKLKSLNRFKAVILVRGGGLSGQAEAIKHGLSRALVQFDQNFKKKLKKGGFLTRDPRAKERRKYGLKKARKAPQWQKR